MNPKPVAPAPAPPPPASGLIVQANAAQLPVANARQVAALDIHGFKVGLVADVRRAATLVIVGEDGRPLDIPAQIPSGAMVAIVLPETAAHLRAGLPAQGKALIPVL